MNGHPTRRGLVAGGLVLFLGGGALAQNVLAAAKPWPDEVDPDAQILVKGLHAMVMRESFEGGRIHVETLMTAVGALAGYAAQNAIRESVVAKGKLPLHGGQDQRAGAFVLVSAKGQDYYFGDLLNSYLVPAQPSAFSPPPTANLYALTGGAVVQAGGTPLSREEIGAIFTRTAKGVGTADFGKPGLAEGSMPHRLPREELTRLWPKVTALMEDRAPEGLGRRLDPAYWPMALGVVAQRLIGQTKAALNPTASMRVVFEAAIPMSKVIQPAAAPAVAPR